MLLSSATDPLLCQAFPTFLEGSALLWFSNLSKGLILDFEQLSKEFTNHFSSSKTYTHSKDALNYIKQGHNKPLRDNYRDSMLWPWKSWIYVPTWSWIWSNTTPSLATLLTRSLTTNLSPWWSLENELHVRSRWKN